MAPRIKITKPSIIEATIEIIRRDGIDSVNARNIALELGCSTQPIFSNFTNMEELKSVVSGEIKSIYHKKTLQALESDKPYDNLILAYVDFALQEKNIFKLMFMSDIYEFSKMGDVIEEEDEKLIEFIMKDKKLSRENAVKLYVATRFYIHGMASYLARNSKTVKTEEIHEYLYEGISALADGYISAEKSK